jgi:hypothetical protein
VRRLKSFIVIEITPQLEGLFRVEPFCGASDRRLGKFYPLNIRTSLSSYFSRPVGPGAHEPCLSAGHKHTAGWATNHQYLFEVSQSGLGRQCGRWAVGFAVGPTRAVAPEVSWSPRSEQERPRKWPSPWWRRSIATVPAEAGGDQTNSIAIYTGRRPKWLSQVLFGRAVRNWARHKADPALNRNRFRGARPKTGGGPPGKCAGDRCRRLQRRCRHHW